jgi:predicted ArsR family transcriptional regulator
MPELNRRFLETTRGRILGLIRKNPQTVEEMAKALSLTDNAVRSHLSTLERDGLVHQTGVRRGPGAGKPASVYEIPADAEPLLSRAYVPMLEALLDELSTQISHEKQEALMRSVGHRLSAAVPASRSGDLETRVRAGAAILDSLGGDAVVEQVDGQLSIRGCGCPLSAATTRRPEVCKAVETLLSDVIGAPVEEACDRKVRPQCRFLIRGDPDR